MSRALAFALLLLGSTEALAGAPTSDVPSVPSNQPAPTLHLLRHTLRPQIQVDGGLSIIGAGYEHPIGHRLALQVEAGVFGTYFLPWFDLGDHAVGGVGGLRLTWFANESGRGLYVTPYVRAGYASGEHEDMDGSGPVVTSGAFVGWAFRPSTRIDVRLGAGGQYIYLGGDFDTSTPFVAIDATVGLRL